MNKAELKKFALEAIKNHPTHKEEIVDLYNLALDEIEQGGSEYHECELAYNEISELIG